MMDNRQFNVNGEGREMLLRALELACIQEGALDRPSKIRSWKVLPDHGMVLYWVETEGNRLPGEGSTAAEFLPMLWAWLESGEASTIRKTGWDVDADHDGSNVPGWRVYVEDWGHVGGSHYTICAVKPVCLWLGK